MIEPEMRDILESFVAETHAFLDVLSHDLVVLESEPHNINLLNKIFRSFHTLKGTASCVGLSAITTVTHSAEDLLKRLAQSEIPVTPAVIVTLIEVHSWIAILIEDLAITADTSPGLVKILEKLSLLSLDTTQKNVQTENIFLKELSAEELLKIDMAFDEGSRTLKKDVRENNDGNDFLKLKPDVKTSTAGKLYQKAPYVVRELSRKFHKEIRLVLKGETTEIESRIIEEMDAPLLHLLRNACDHGIETTDVRQMLLKPRYGTITLSTLQKENSLILSIHDDGAGLNAEKIKKKAIGQKLITSQMAENLSLQEAFRLIFAPGLSTAGNISNTSGRGVGMDVVFTNIQRLNGVISIDSEIGKGTTFTIILPRSPVI